MTDTADTADAADAAVSGVARVDWAGQPVSDSALETVRERAEECGHEPAQVCEGGPGLAAGTLVRDRVRVAARTRD